MEESESKVSEVDKALVKGTPRATHVALRVRMVLRALAPTVSGSDPEDDDLDVVEKYMKKL